MSITSGSFLLFFLVLTIVYFTIPKKTQWTALLAASLVFYGMAGVMNSIYIVITAVTVYFAAILIEKNADKQKKWIKENKEATKEEKSKYKDGMARKRKALLVCTLVINIGILCVFKYTNFVLSQINNISLLFGGAQIADSIKFIVPLGLSFYTFQTVGYIVDVYWKKVTAQKNFGKMLLFVSFFPQVTQGPISDYSQLSEQLFSSHSFSYENFVRGSQRMIWGYAKKLIIAETLAPYVADVFDNYASYTGITVFIGALFYSVQIYADFSGYMDIVCGLCEILGIKLCENFDRPYFSKSIAEYWRRWHISLGAWFKTYLYYPIAVAKWNQKLGKAAQKRFGKHVGQTIPASIALVAVWVTTGLWHGASWGYIAWGGVNGLFIIFSLWMEPVYAKCKKLLRINEEKWGWRAFQTIRTFYLVTLIKVLPEVGSLKSGLGLWKQIFTDYTLPTTFSQLFPYADKEDLNMIIIGIVLMFTASLIQRKVSIRTWFAQTCPVPVRFIVMAVLIIVTIYFGCSGNAGGFLYAQF